MANATLSLATQQSHGIRLEGVAVGLFRDLDMRFTLINHLKANGVPLDTGAIVKIIDEALSLQLGFDPRASDLPMFPGLEDQRRALMALNQNFWGDDDLNNLLRSMKVDDRVTALRQGRVRVLNPSLGSIEATLAAWRKVWAGPGYKGGLDTVLPHLSALRLADDSCQKFGISIVTLDFDRATTEKEESISKLQERVLESGWTPASTEVIAALTVLHWRRIYQGMGDIPYFCLAGLAGPGGVPIFCREENNQISWRLVGPDHCANLAIPTIVDSEYIEVRPN